MNESPVLSSRVKCPAQEHTLQWGKEARGPQPGDVTSVASCRGRVMAYDTLQVTRVPY